MPRRRAAAGSAEYGGQDLGHRPGATCRTSAGISLDDEVKTYLLDQVFDLGPYGRFEQLAFRRINRFFTTGFLPKRFRDELGLAWGPRRQRTFELVLRAIGFVTAAGPEQWRLYPLNRHLADMRRRRALGKPLV